MRHLSSTGLPTSDSSSSIDSSSSNIDTSSLDHDDQLSGVDASRPRLPLPVPRIHKHLLYLSPQQYEQECFGQLYVLDLVDCIMTPWFVSSFIKRLKQPEPDPFTAILTVLYCVVLVLKGYQMGLILLPAAAQARAHAKSRYTLLLALRVLRQWLIGFMTGRSPSARSWALQMCATNAPTVPALKVIILYSGSTFVILNTFCQPMDIRASLVLNSTHVLLIFPGQVATVAYAVGVLTRSFPILPWFQWCLEFLCSTVADGFWGGTRKGNWSHRLAAAAVSVPPGPAPDVDSVAGRLSLALSTWLMLLVVLYVPLFLSWRLERHFKAKFMAADAAAAAGVTGMSAVAADGSVAGRASEQSDSMFQTLPDVMPLLQQQPSEVIRHLGLAAGVCFVASELFVLLCVRWPALLGVLSKQIPCIEADALH